MQPFIYYSPDYGGGQVIRTLLCLSLLYPNWKITIHQIRSNKPNPGLHDQLVSTLTLLCREGYLSCHPQPHVGLKSITLTGLTPRTQTFKLSQPIITDGSIWLVIQALLPVILLRGGTVTVSGVYYGSNSLINEQQIINILSVTGLENEIKLISSRTGVNGTITISSHGIKLTPIQFSNRIWSPYQKDTELLGKLYWVDDQISPRTCLFRTTDKSPELFDWQVRVLESTGLDYSVFDNLFELAIILGGQIEYPMVLDELDSNLKPFDSHMRSLFDLVSNLEKVGYCQLLTESPDKITIQVVN